MQSQLVQMPTVPHMSKMLGSSIITVLSVSSRIKILVSMYEKNNQNTF